VEIFGCPLSPDEKASPCCLVGDHFDMHNFANASSLGVSLSLARCGKRDKILIIFSTISFD
jgi:hypothetical protein